MSKLLCNSFNKRPDGTIIILNPKINFADGTILNNKPVQNE